MTEIDFYPEAPRHEDMARNDMEFTHVPNETEDAPKCYAFYPEEFAPEHAASKAVDLGGFRYSETRQEITCLFCLRFDEIAELRDDRKAVTSPGYILERLVQEAERMRPALERHGVHPSHTISQEYFVWLPVRTLELAQRDRRFERWTRMESPY